MSETKEIKPTTDVGDVSGVVNTGEIVIEMLNRFDDVQRWTYKGQLNNEEQPHGRGTISLDELSYTMQWEDGEPVVGCNVFFTCYDNTKFEGELVKNIEYDSKRRVFRTWTMRGTVLFNKLSASYTGTIKDMKFYEGVFKTAILTIRIHRQRSSLINGKYTDPCFCMIVSDSYSGITFYKIGTRLFYNRDGVTYCSLLTNSSFLNSLTNAGHAFDIVRIESPLVSNMYNFSMDDYVSDEELARMAGF